jgi:hypothetical protein
MAAVWLDADVPAVARLARLVDQEARGEAGSRVLAEIRSLEDRFGLSPMARRRLQWELDQVTGASVQPIRRRGGGDPREARPLRAVEAGEAS